VTRDGLTELRGQYRGEMRFGTANGQGEVVWSGGSDGAEDVGRYQGGFKGGAMHGKGTFTWAGSGDVYEGEWKRDQMHGLGEQRRGDGTVVHKGRWANDEPQMASGNYLAGGLPLGIVMQSAAKKRGMGIASE
jgi:hypothetical protein